jgi:glycosyltransferase involved in cell wall biosynthesis
VNAPQVVVVSNIPHSFYLAEALASQRMLAQYLGPVLHESSSLSMFPVTRSRNYPGVDRLPLQRLVSPELAQRVLSRIPLRPDRRARVHSRALDRSAARRIRPLDVLHWHTAGLVQTPALARRMGAVLVADHRDIHPADHDYADPLLRLLRVEFQMADHVLVNSELAAESMARNGVLESKLSVVPLGADIDLFSPDPLPNPSPLRRDRVLFVGSITRRKGVDLIVEVASLPRFRDVEFVLAGPGVDPSITAAAGRLSNIALLGPVPRRQLPQLYRSATVALLPSRIDAYGLVVAEALACGTPVIVSDRCGSATLVRQHGCGLVMPAGSAAALSEHLAHLLDDRNLRTRLSQAARTATPLVSWTAYQRTVLTWYEDSLLHPLARPRKGWQRA